MAEAPVAVTMKITEYNRLIDEWALAIGRFLITFTDREYYIHLYLGALGSAELRSKSAHLNLAPRARVARKLILGRHLTDEIRKRVEVAFNTLTRLARTRNLIAHNGPMVHVYQNSDGAFEIRHELRSARDPTKDITIPELEKLHAEAHDLNEELALLFGLVRKPENRTKATAAQRPAH